MCIPLIVSWISLNQASNKQYMHCGQFGVSEIEFQISGLPYFYSILYLYAYMHRQYVPLSLLKKKFILEYFYAAEKKQTQIFHFKNKIWHTHNSFFFIPIL